MSFEQFSATNEPYRQIRPQRNNVASVNVEETGAAQNVAVAAATVRRNSCCNGQEAGFSRGG